MRLQSLTLQTACVKNLENARTQLEKALKAAVNGVKSAHCTTKLKAALEKAGVAERFTTAVAPPALPDDDEELKLFLGVPEGPLQKHAALARIRTQWAAHMSGWNAPLTSPTPLDVNVYWTTLSSAAPELSSVALLNWLRPISSAASERNGSLLSKLDIPSRQSMSLSTLKDVLYLRCNSAIVNDLITALADSTVVVSAGTPAQREERSKQLRSVVLEAQQTVRAAQDARLAVEVAATSAARAAAAAAAATTSKAMAADTDAGEAELSGSDSD